MWHRVVLPLLAFILVQVSATCYFPDGDISPADVACDASASDSFCCFSRQACLSNKLCLAVVDGENTYARGTCTDPSWQSGACPNFCLDQQALGNPVFSCNVTGSDEYCCNDGCSCDATVGDEVVSFTGTPYTISVIGVAGTYPNPSATTSSSSATSSTSTTSETSTSSSSSTASASTGSSASNTAAPAATSSTPSSPSASSKGGSNSVAIGAGVGVGVGVGILLIGAGAFFLYRRRAKARKNPRNNYTEKPTPEEQGDSGGHNNYAEQTGKQDLQQPSRASELSPAGHEYSELGTDRTHAARPPQAPGISELPGQ